MTTIEKTLQGAPESQEVISRRGNHKMQVARRFSARLPGFGARYVLRHAAESLLQKHFAFAVTLNPKP